MMSSLESLSDERSGLVILTVLLEVSKTDFLNNPQPLNGAESIISPGERERESLTLNSQSRSHYHVKLLLIRHLRGATLMSYRPCGWVALEQKRPWCAILAGSEEDNLFSNTECIDLAHRRRRT